MGKYKKKFASFMYGRYGNDALNMLLMILYLVLAIVGMFIEGKWALVLLALEIAVIGFAMFRMMSRNIAKRRRENAFLERIGRKIRDNKQLRQNKKRDKLTHVYKKCPKCHAILRFPRVAGKHTATCPKCKNKLNVNIRK